MPSKLGRLVVHLGPPKTATTSLQYFFQSNTFEGIYYLGEKQPRNFSRLSFSWYLYQCCIQNEVSENNEVVENLRKQLSDLLLTHDFVILSEEMYLVENSQKSSIEKLKNLYKIIHQFNPLIIFGMRNSAKAMQSYFEEIHTELPESLQYNFPKFEESTYVDCFKYKKLFLALSSIGFKKIKPFLFKELVKGNYYLGDLIILDSTDKLKFRVKLPIANSSSSLDQRRHLKRKSLIERILIFIFSSLGMKIRQNKLFLKLTYFLQFYSTKKVLLKSSNKVKVEYEKDLKFFNMLSN